MHQNAPDELGDPTAESYHVPTLREYVRHNDRRSQSDAELSDRISRLHCGEWRPEVHRVIEHQTVPLRDIMLQKNV